jgi:ketosteroid isomerase-like protein
MRAAPIVSLVFIAAGALGCTPAAQPDKPTVDTAKIIDAIKADEVHWNADWQARDDAKIASHYTPRAILMISQTPVATGEAAIQATVRQALADPAFTLTFASDKVDVAASGDLAAARGSYKLTATDPKTKAVTTETGTFVTVYKPQKDGTWKAIWDIAAPGPPASVGATMAGAPPAKGPQ